MSYVGTSSFEPTKLHMNEVKVDVSVEMRFSDYLTYKTYAQGLSIHLHKNGECADMEGYSIN